MMGEALKSARAKAAKLTESRSEAYRIGYSEGSAAFHRAGTPNLSPSMNDKRDWGHDWKNFMAGWRKAQTEWMQS